MSASISSAGSPHTASFTPPTGEQKAALQKLVAQYTQHVQNGTAPDVLARLAQTIKSDARSLGVNVTLPSASAAVATIIHQTLTRLGAPISNGGLTTPDSKPAEQQDVKALVSDYQHLAANGQAAAAITGFIATAQADAKSHGLTGTVGDAIARVIGQTEAATAGAAPSPLNLVG